MSYVLFHIETSCIKSIYIENDFRHSLFCFTNKSKEMYGMQFLVFTLQAYSTYCYKQISDQRRFESNTKQGTKTEEKTFCFQMVIFLYGFWCISVNKGSRMIDQYPI